MNKANYLLVFFALIFLFVGCKKDEEPKSSIHIHCLEQLDTASKCQAILPECAGAGTGKQMFCLGKTNAGVRCSRTVSDVCGFCWQHTSQNDGTCPNETTNACGYCNDHTDQYKP